MERMAEEKVNLAFVDLFSIFRRLFFGNILSIVFHLYEFPEEPSAWLV